MTGEPAPARRTRITRRRVLRTSLVIAAILVLLGAWAAIRYPPLLDDARDLRGSLERVADRALAAGPNIDRADLEALRVDMAAARQHQARLSEVVTGDPLVGLAAMIPQIGRQRDAAGSLLEATSALLDAGERMMVVADRYVTVGERKPAGSGAGSTMAELVGMIADSRDDVAAALESIHSAQASLAKVPDDAVGQIVAARDRAQDLLNRYAPLIGTYAEVDDVLPSILGWEGRRRYLVLAQNPAELRPSGGYIGTYGIVEFESGRLVSHRFRDTQALDGQPGLPYVEPPGPLRDHLLGGRPWRLSDVNWSPDFPTTARQAIDLYRIESGGDEVDGVIALTTYALDELMTVVGPIEVPDYGVTVAPGETTLTAFAHTRPATTAPGTDRKAFLQSFASALFDRLLSMPVERLPDLVPALQTIAAERRASAWLVDPAAQAFVERGGLAGGVRDDDGDFLYVVDANVGPVSKLNLVTERHSELHVRLDGFGNAHHELTVTWQNRIGEPGLLRDMLLAYQRRETMGSYLRVIAPELSRLLSVEGGSDRLSVLGADSVGEEDGRSVFGVYQIVPPGTTVLRVSWVAPYVVDDPDAAGQRRYRLTLQKQPGTVADAVAIRIVPPDDARIVAAGEGVTVAEGGGSAEVSTHLRTDLQLWVELAPR